MPVKSYLAYPMSGRFFRMLHHLRAEAACEVFPAENRKLAILVTETENESAEKELLNRLEQIPSLQCLALVHGHRDNLPGD